LISFKFFIAVTTIKTSDIRVFFGNGVFSVARQTWSFARPAQPIGREMGNVNSR